MFNFVVGKTPKAKEHPKMEVYRCDKCGRTFLNASDLNMHERLHTFKCDDCLQVFKSYSSLIKHARLEIISTSHFVNPRKP